MEQIIITRRDGTTYPLAIKKDAVAIKEAKQSWALLGDDVVNISIESPYPQRYEIGDYFHVFGRMYKLNQLPRMKKSGVYKFTYDLTFEGVQYDLLRVFYDVTIETTGNTIQDVQGDALTGNLHRFATVLVSNANRVFPGKWKLGNCPETTADKTLTFGETDNCLAVFQNLCQTFEVEASITLFDGIYTINFYNKIGKTHPFVFEFGKGRGLYALDRQNVDNSNVVTRLKVYGSDANITNKYRANRLCLPGKNKGQSFIEEAAAVEKYGIHEACKIFDDIKPTFNGKVTAIVDGNVLKFKDENMFDLNAKEADGTTTKYLINGTTAKIHFNTGDLAGYEFDVHKYEHNSRTFTIKQITDDRGYNFPNPLTEAFQISVGDEYKILDVTLPEQYINAAEHKLQEKGNEYYRQNNQPKVKYGLSVSRAYLKKLFGSDVDGTLLTPGDYINIKDGDIGVNKAIRIQALQRDLLNVYDYSLTISDTADNNITTRVISELIEIDKITTINNLKDPARAKANWRSSRELLNMVFDPEGDYYSDKIKPNSIDTLALSVGAKSMQFALKDIVFEPNYNGHINNVHVSAGTLTHYAIEEQPRTWDIAQTLVTLQENASPYYIFARCERVGRNASIVFSKTPFQAEQDLGAYFFWVGVVNSVDPVLHARSLSLSYGFSMINGGFIKTGRIESMDGKTYFDLNDSEIGGNIVFTSNGQTEYLEEFSTDVRERIDSKNRTFVSTPNPPYDIGDLWVDGKVLKRCRTARAQGSYNANDWVEGVAYDNTKTIIDGGLVTSGTIQVAGDNTTILAGITGKGTANDAVRFWAGATFANRANAPFRVLQNGYVVMSRALIEGDCVFSGFVKPKETRITAANYEQYMKVDNLGNSLDFSKLTGHVILDASLDTVSDFMGKMYCLLSFRHNGAYFGNIDDYIGARLKIVNNTKYNLGVSGLIVENITSANSHSISLAPKHELHLRCFIRFLENEKQIGWLVEYNNKQ